MKLPRAESPAHFAKLVIIFAVFALVSFLATVAVHLGFFKGVSIEQTSLEKKNLVYKLHIGPYHKINDEIVRVEKWAKDSNVQCLETFGEYLSDPEKVSEEMLRSHAGCVVNEIPESLPENFEARTVSFDNVILASFGGSPAIGPFKVYPKVEDFIQEKGLNELTSVFEFYNFDKETEVFLTKYVFPINEE